ncbi:hypothetical protein PENTCL1PPCAC_26640, partial [Pristionchus entomophagus]
SCSVFSFDSASAAFNLSLIDSISVKSVFLSACSADSLLIFSFVRQAKAVLRDSIVGLAGRAKLLLGCSPSVFSSSPF